MARLKFIGFPNIDKEDLPGREALPNVVKIQILYRWRRHLKSIPAHALKRGPVLPFQQKTKGESPRWEEAS
jgi:hypothetical protein